MKTVKILLILGARPQIIKSAPLIQLAEKDRDVSMQIVHTGQHYDYEMSKQFFDELRLPDPIVNLNVGSGTHAWQTGKMMIQLEKLLLNEKPHIVVVPGDTNSALAGALAAVKLHIPIAHMESGPRSYNMKIPEEVNRRLTDHISTLLFAPTENCCKNLLKEGINRKSICLVGDTMYDSFLLHFSHASKDKVLDELNLKTEDYAVLTLHRPENVDFPEKLRKIMETMLKIKDLVIVFPVHPRTLKAMKKAGFKKETLEKENIKLVKPMNYHGILKSMKDAKIVFTDSGGMQKEAFWLGTPCVTLRNETEWPETIDLEANVIVGVNPKRILSEVQRILENKDIKKMLKQKPNPFGDGKASEKILNILKEFCLRS